MEEPTVVRVLRILISEAMLRGELLIELIDRNPDSENASDFDGRVQETLHSIDRMSGIIDYHLKKQKEEF